MVMLRYIQVLVPLHSMRVWQPWGWATKEARLWSTCEKPFGNEE